MTLPRRAGYRVALPARNVKTRLLAHQHLPTLLNLLQKLEVSTTQAGPTKDAVPKSMNDSLPLMGDEEDVVLAIERTLAEKQVALHETCMRLWSKTLEMLLAARAFRDVSELEIQKQWDTHMSAYSRLATQLDQAAETAKQAARRSRERKTYLKGRRFHCKSTAVLEKWYCAHQDVPYPTAEEKERLALECGLEVQQVTTWFANRRSRTISS